MKSSTESVPDRAASPDRHSEAPATLRPGQPFNPYGLFYGIFVPDALARFKDVSPGAKLAYARLLRYAGQDGTCYPRQQTLAAQIGVTDRQVRSYIQDLVRQQFLRVVRKGLHAPNEYVFLWHEVFNAADRKEASGQDRKHSSGQDRQKASAPISRESGQDTQFKKAPTTATPQTYEQQEQQRWNPARWPKTDNAITDRFPTTSPECRLRILNKAMAAADGHPTSDDVLAQAIETATEKNQRSGALYETTVPNCIRNWVIQHRRTA